MSSITMEFHEYIAYLGAELESVDDRFIVTGGQPIGLEHYPIFDANYRDELNSKIIAHYFNREIGMETPDMFRLAIRRRMNEIMPYFNKLYSSELINFDPLSTVDITTTNSGTMATVNTNDANTTASTNTDSKSRSVSSETPQVLLSGNGDYATSAADANGQSEATNTASELSTFNSDAINEGESTTKGYQGSAADLIMKYRQALLNVDMMVIEAIEDCFMLVYDNNDDFTEGRFIYYV